MDPQLSARLLWQPLELPTKGRRNQARGLMRLQRSDLFPDGSTSQGVCLLTSEAAGVWALDQRPAACEPRHGAWLGPQRVLLVLAQ